MAHQGYRKPQRARPALPPPPAAAPAGADIHFYDFDGTLFRSPVPSPRPDEEMELLTAPTFVPGGLGWFQSKKTLSAPFVPWNPRLDDEWFVMPTVQQFFTSVADGHHVVVSTGREEYFRDRVVDLLSIAGINPHRLYLKPRRKLGTVRYKVDAFASEIAAVQPNRVVIVDDRVEQAQRIVAELQQLFPNVSFSTRIVEGGSKVLPLPAETQLIKLLRADAEIYGCPPANSQPEQKPKHRPE